MPNLMDMFQPRSAMDNQPIGFGDAIAQNRNSLIGLGMGMLQPRSLAYGAPAQSAWTNALGGYQQGAQTDAANAYRQAQLAHTKRQEAFQRSQAAQAQANFERTFARSDPANIPTEFTKAARDLNLTPGTPKHSEFAKQFYSTKSEGNLAAQAEQRQTIAKNLGLDVNDPKVKGWLASGGTLNEEGKPLPAEMASRIALGGKFLDEAPAIRRKIESGMATDSLEGRVKTYFNMGDQGELARKIKSGTDALLRSLTGAGMPDAEARKYISRYEIQPYDNQTTVLSKFDQLHDELSRAEQEAFRGRGGIPRDVIDRRKAAHEAVTPSPFGAAPAVTGGAAIPAPPAGFKIVQ